MNNRSTLEMRLDAALKPDAVVTSADIGALIEEAEAGIAKAEEAGAVGRTYSLDPKAARQAIEEATFAANRLRTLRSRLEVRYEEVHYQEQVTGWLAEYEEQKRARDVLAEELSQVYPDAVAKIVDLFDRITANDETLSQLHLARPAGVTEHLHSAELYARGLDKLTRDSPSLLTSVHLIDWVSGSEIWPPPRPSMASMFAATVPACDRRLNADWAKDNEHAAAQARAEQQRIADYYARTTKEQEDRENAEARERFLTQQQQLTINRPVKA